MRTNTSNGRPRSNNKVIPMRLDAAFFYERGVRYLERNDLKRALKAFRKTVEYEPQNPINHCNLAGVLSELGDFEASNQVLLHVLEDLDPTMTECQFYLANNYANMGQYHAAEEYALRYLDSDPDGEYAEDAEEMLSVLMDEFGGGHIYAEWEKKRREQERNAAMRDGRHLLEEGQFEAAVEWLERIVRNEPSNTAAQNNLSLAYYYTGQYEKAIALTEHVLSTNPHNIHALCNLTVYSAQSGPKERLQACVKQLVKLFPLHYDQALKIGTTLGLIGEHEAAYHVFDRLVHIVDRPEPALIHSLAAAAANTGRYQTAKKWWRVLAQQPEAAEVAAYYVELMNRQIRQGKRALRVGYQYDLPLQVQFARMKKRLHEGDLVMWRQDPLLRASLYWGLRHGNTETRKAVIRTLALMADDDAERALRLFLKRPDVEASLQHAALYVLQLNGRRGRVEVYRDGALQSVRMSELPKDLVLRTDPVWPAILEAAQAWLRAHHAARWTAEAKRMCMDFAKQVFLRSDMRLVKPDVWAGALVYVLLKHTDKPVRQKDVAADFGVSPSSLGKAAQRLDWLVRKARSEQL
ncbi:MAG: tetratricopeptide repeat protein [Alicyclobacillus sp.]|nr:tetratricopeptide repeat protein [Alicyclobacillus sp.]